MAKASQTFSPRPPVVTVQPPHAAASLGALSVEGSSEGAGLPESEASVDGRQGGAGNIDLSLVTCGGYPAQEKGSAAIRGIEMGECVGKIVQAAADYRDVVCRPLLLDFS